MRRAYNYANATVDINSTQTTSDEIRDVIATEGESTFALYDRRENVPYQVGVAKVSRDKTGAIVLRIFCNPSDIEPATRELYLRLKDIA